MEKRIQIFLSDAGQFREASKHKFIAEFADERAAKHYVDYLFKKHSGKHKDIIVKEYQLEHPLVNAKTVSIIAESGECLPLDEYGIV